MNELMQMVEQFTKKNLNDANESTVTEVAKETGNSLLEGLKGGNITDLLNLGDSSDTNALASNPMIGSIIENLSGNLTKKVGLDSTTSNQFAGSVIPQLISTVIAGVKDGKFNLSDLMSMAGAAGLDQNGDGKLDLKDAMEAVTNGKLGDMLGGFLKK
ncbi:MAG TPA: hypothetical protein VKY32_07670 [Flavobacterium sp.]|nr:hypothetical protein [Flavobacterium sp.]